MDWITSLFGSIEWMRGPLKELWGVPIWWVERVAKLLQFASGCVILVEIVGKERVEVGAGQLRERLAVLKAAEPLTRIAAGLREAISFYWRVVAFHTRRVWHVLRTADPLPTEYVPMPAAAGESYVVATAVVVTTLPLALTVYAAVVLPRTWHLLWQLLVAFLFFSVVSWLAAFASLVVALVIVRIVFGTIGEVLDAIAAGALYILSKRPLAQLLLLLSFLLLVFGVALELAAS